MKKFIKFSVIIIISLTVAATTFLHFAPVSFDAFSCTGGYRRWVADAYSERLVKIFLVNKGLNHDTTFELVSKPEEIANTVKWRGRNIYAAIRIHMDGKIYRVDFMGKRYWTEKYDWKIKSIDL